MSSWSGDAELLATFFLEVQSWDPSRMIFSSVVKIKLATHLLAIESVDLVLFNVEVSVIFIFPEGDAGVRLGDFQPVPLVEIVRIIVRVSHDFIYKLYDDEYYAMGQWSLEIAFKNVSHIIASLDHRVDLSLHCLYLLLLHLLGKYAHKTLVKLVRWLYYYLKTFQGFAGYLLLPVLVSRRSRRLIRKL